jgi:hypothetical protein
LKTASQKIAERLSFGSRRSRPERAEVKNFELGINVNQINQLADEKSGANVRQ